MKFFFLFLFCLPSAGMAQTEIPAGITTETDKFTKSTVYKLANPGSFSGANNCIQPEIVQSETELFMRVKFVHRGYREARAANITIAVGDQVVAFIPNNFYITTFTRFAPGKRALDILFGPDEGPDSFIEIYSLDLKNKDLERFIALFSDPGKKEKLALRFENGATSTDYPEPDFHNGTVMAGTLKKVALMVNFYKTLTAGQGLELLPNSL